MDVSRYPLLDALRGRRSRRFVRGLRIEHGQFTFASTHPPQPLTEAEEAALAFAACGVTGYALADLSYGVGEGGSMLAGLLGRTIASADAVNVISVAVINDDGAFLLRRPQDFPRTDIPELARLAEAGELTELYRRSRVRVTDGRVKPPLEPPYNFPINRWSLYAPGTTYFLPIAELTTLYVNVLLELFDESMGVFIADERAGLLPAGVGRFGRSRGGHLCDNSRDARFATVAALEGSLSESAAAEQGMVLQNLGLMAQALGLCGFVNFARHEWSWFEALGFTMGRMPATQYLGAPWWTRLAARLARREVEVRYPLALEHPELPLRPLCPPSYPSMAAAVRAMVARKFGPDGAYPSAREASAWRDGEAGERITGPSEQAVAATAAYCEYLYRRYGRFPAYPAPFRTVLGYQVGHGEVEFYDRYFRPEALTETQRLHRCDGVKTNE